MTARRLNTVQEYYFSKKLREVAAMVAAGKPVINMGIGSPDLPAHPKVVAALKESFDYPKVHQYQSYQGLPELRQAIANFYQKYYQYTADPNSEILPLMGSKEGIMHISMAYLNEGDAVLIPNPGYPTYSSVTKLVGATPIFYDLTAENHWQPQISALERLDLSRVKIMWINYPHMPTGTLGSEQHLTALIQFAKKHNILLVNDNPYSFIFNDNPNSLFNIKGAKEVCLELNSLSKSFNMAGWRVGMLLGAEQHINNVIKVKSNMDSGMFYGVQKGAIAALKSSNDWFTSLNEVYKKRRALVWELATQLGCTFEPDTAGMFVWAKLSQGIDAEQFIDTLLIEKNIFVAPGTIFGSNGEGYIRFSLCAPIEDINEALKRTA